MGFLSGIIGAAVNVVLTPVAVVKDVANIAMGDEPTSTQEHIENITDQVEEAFDEII